MGHVTADNFVGRCVGIPYFRTMVTLCAATKGNASFVKSVNTYLREIFPSVSWTAVAIVHRDGHRPMKLHVHLGYVSALSAELCVGGVEGGEFRTEGLIPVHAPTREGSVLYGRGPVVGHIVDPRDAVIFNVWRPHCPLLSPGKRYAIAMYTGVARDKVPAFLQRRTHEFNFPL